MHTDALCGFCVEAALHCTCEHIYAAMLLEKRIIRDVAKHPKKKAAAKATAAPVAAILSPAKPNREFVRPSAPVGDPPLNNLLQALELAPWIPAFAKEAITFESLSDWSLPELRAVLG